MDISSFNAATSSDRLGDNGRREGLSKLVGNAARALDTLQQEIERGGATAATPANGTPLHLDVRRARSLRNLRKRMLGAELYSGPAWEILLHLFESHVLQRRDTIGNVSDGAEVAGATTLRWIGRLEQESLVVLHDDHLDRRRRFVELSAGGVEMMTRYFSGVSPHQIAA